MQQNRPLILVCNDDGIFAKGIHTLIEAVMPYGDVVVVAPDSAQSGMGHAVTINGILRLASYELPFEGVEAYTCSGTPVDAVKLAIYKVLGRKPDLLVSGINHGANSSINVIYSGTMSAAMEGAIEGIPSIGFSLLNHDANADFTVCKSVVDRVVSQVLHKEYPKGICLNVNIPNCKPEELKGMKVCRQAKAFWKDAFEPRNDPSGKEYYWLTGVFENTDGGEDTDEWALAHNYASIVPVQYDLTAHHAMSALNQWNLELPS